MNPEPLFYFPKNVTKEPRALAEIISRLLSFENV